MNATERTSDKDYLALLEKYKLFTTGRQAASGESV